MDRRAPGSGAPGEEGPGLPLSAAQEQLWFLDQLVPGQPTYNVPMAYRIRGSLDVDALRDALDVVLRRHEPLRASFHARDGVPFQRIAPPGEVPLVVQDLSGLEPLARGQQLDRELRAAAVRPFDLSAGPLARFQLFRLSAEDHVLSSTIHHIVTDGWSAGVLNRELSAGYAALRAGAQPEPDELPLRYANYVERQRERFDDELVRSQLSYWERQLADLPVLDLPTDRIRPAVSSNRGDTLSAHIPSDLLDACRLVARQHAVPLFTVLAAAVAVVLARLTKQEDVPVGMTTLGRKQPEYESLIGLFATMVVLRVDLSGDPSLAELFDRIADATFDAYDHDDVPFERVVRHLQPARDPSRNPLFQVAVQLLGGSNSGADLRLDGLEVEPVLVHAGQSRFDLSLTFVELADTLRLDLEYSTDLFDPDRIRTMGRHVEQVLRAVCADPGQPALRAPMLTGAERAELLELGRGDPLPPQDDPVHVVIAARAAEAPDAVAASFRGKELTYGELDRRADLLARYLHSLGVRHEQVVAVAMDRGLDTTVAQVAVLKAGAAFAILDPTHPAGRNEFILQDTAASVVLTRSALTGRLPAGPWRAVPLDTAWPEVEAVPVDGPSEGWVTRDSLAYILYTSGSTGRPKGVQIEHRALAAFVESFARHFGLAAGDRMLQSNALTFDMAQGETFTGLMVGATLVLVPPEAATPDGLAGLIAAERVTYICIGPALLAHVEAGDYPSLSKVMVGGEPCPSEVVNRWNLPGRRMMNLYGPTEATVGCSDHICAPVPYRSVPPIGRPHLGRQLYVVDQWDNLVPRTVPGELLIGGEEGLARGYHNRPELTAERFVADPFRSGGRVYRSGDLVRWNADDELEYLGRLDTQVKLRGLRIELEEIEAVLLGPPAVAAAVVALRPDRRGEPRLVGYVVPAADPPSPGELADHLAGQLPAYMVPTAWQVLDRFPHTSSGKIDRGALPVPEDPAADLAAGVPASTPTEAKVAEVFADVLALPEVGADIAFFDLGGNSLQAMRVVSRLDKVFGVKVTVRSLYGAATVRAVAGLIDDKIGGTPSGIGREPAPAGPGATRGA